MPAVAKAPSPARQLASFLARFNPDIAGTAQAVRRRLHARMPGAVELVYDNYRGLVLGYSPTEKPSDAVVSMMVTPDHVSFIFIHGAKLADPRRILRGGGNQVRHMRLTDASDLDKPEVRALLDEALRRAKPFEKGAKRRLVVRAVSPKALPRRPTGRKSLGRRLG